MTSTVTAPGLAVATVGPFSGGLPPLLAEAAILILAESAGADGVDVPNAGTAGATYNADALPAASGLDIPPVLVTPALGDVQVVSSKTDSAQLVSTPHKASLNIDGPVDLRWSARGIGDATAGGGSFFFNVISKFKTNSDATMMYGAAVTLVDDGNLVGALTFPWRDDFDPASAPDLPGGVVDPYTAAEYRMTLELGLSGDPSGHGWNSTNRLTTYIRDDTLPDVTTVDGKGWRRLVTADTARHDTFQGATVAEGNPSSRPAFGTGPLTFLQGQGVGGYCEVRAGIDGTLVADCNPARDSSGAGDTSWVSATTGETWTIVGTYTELVDTDRPGIYLGPKPGATPPRLVIADGAGSEIGATDATFAFWADLHAVATADGHAYVWASKLSGTLGAGGIGWELLDVHIDAFASNFAGVAATDGTHIATAVGTRWSVGRHLIVGVFDRDGDLTVMVDGTELSSPVMTTVGDLSNSAGIYLGESGGTGTMTLLAYAQWNRVLTPTEITTTLPAALGA